MRTFVALLCLSTLPCAAQARRTVPFPLAGTGADLSLRAEAAAELAALEHAVLSGVPLPGGDVELVVERVRHDASELEVRLDGAPARALHDPLASCWRGRIVGSERSEVFLGFSSYGSRGWLRDGTSVWHLLTGPGEGGDWTRASARFASEEQLLGAGLSPLRACEARPRPGSQPAPLPAASGPALAAGAPGSAVRVCRMAVETDFQLYQRFQSVPALQAYLGQLFAALSARFDLDVDVQIQVVHLGLHSQPNDGWSAPDTGAGAGALLDEFRLAWSGNLPNGAHLAHFLSGAALGGGVAYVGVLCSPEWGFAVSGDLSGSTPFPLVQGPLTWDFFVFGHETGHNFGSWHTHDYCPPFDLCATNCSGQSACSQGTIMSYCHTCGAGMANIQLAFHPGTADVMRQAVASSCLPVLCAGAQSYCGSAPNSYDPFGAYLSHWGSNRISRNDLVLAATGVPPGTSGLFFYGANAVQTPFGNGWRCVGNPLFRLGVVPANPFGEANLAVNYATLPANGQISAGQTWNFQYWYRNPAGGGAGFNLSDALRLQFCP
ncbi:MAG: hypothetical protein JNK02_14430 [Planctomycetes bacterium]|nr:hypothetical protein [Planctomycetota bacterium]